MLESTESIPNREYKENTNVFDEKLKPETFIGIEKIFSRMNFSKADDCETRIFLYIKILQFAIPTQLAKAATFCAKLKHKEKKSNF